MAGLSQGSEPAVAASHWTKAKRAEYYKQYTARPEVKAKRAKYMKQYMKQYNAKPEYKAKKAEYKKTATRGGGGSKTATHP